MISIFHLQWLILSLKIYSILEKTPSALEKNMYSADVWWILLYMSVKSIWSNVQFKSNVSLLIFCLCIQHGIQRIVFKSPIMNNIKLIFCVFFYFLYILFPFSPKFFGANIFHYSTLSFFVLLAIIVQFNNLVTPSGLIVYCYKDTIHKVISHEGRL